MNSDFSMLLNDFNSSDDPKWYDDATVHTLIRIVDSIHNGKYDIPCFEYFADNNLGKGEFHDGCVNFVQCVDMYLKYKS